MRIEVFALSGYSHVQLKDLDSKNLLFSHENNRLESLPCCLNHGVDVLLTHRFELGMELLNLVFPQIQIEVPLEEFLLAGGFDEALHSENWVDEFKLRWHEVTGNHADYTLQLEVLNSASPSRYLSKKLSLRNGNLEPFNTEMSREKHDGVKNFEIGNNSRLEMTLGVTLGSFNLAEQFLKSLSDSICEYDSLHLVVCCFRLDESEVKSLISSSNIPFLSVKVLSEAWGYEKAVAGVLGPWYVEKNLCSGVSWGRCVLHRALAEFSPTPVMWILDDDVMITQNSLAEVYSSIQLMQGAGATVGIGVVIGDGPIPPPYMVRTQLVDFYYASCLEQSCVPFESISPDLHFHDMHHDLAMSNTSHLEYPIGVNVAHRVGSFDLGVFNGKSLTRKVHSQWKSKPEILTRGGNTIVIGKRPLLDYSNMAPSCGGITLRRGDTFWTKQILEFLPSSIMNIPVSLVQNRLSDFQFGTLNGIRGDILGSILSRLLFSKKDCQREVVQLSQLREARLIANLYRSKALMGLMNITGKELHALEKLLNDLVVTDWPQSVTNELGYFLKNYTIQMKEFQYKGG
jgi:hypothetical protein